MRMLRGVICFAELQNGNVSLMAINLDIKSDPVTNEHAIQLWRKSVNHDFPGHAYALRHQRQAILLAVLTDVAARKHLYTVNQSRIHREGSSPHIFPLIWTGKRRREEKGTYRTKEMNKRLKMD